MAKQFFALADRVKQLREAAGMSQQALAVSAGLSISVITQLEQGQKADPRISTVAALAQALGVTVDELLREEEKPAPSAEDMPPAQHKPRGRKARRPRGG